MALRPQSAKTTVDPIRDIALDLTKAALAGGALRSRQTSGDATSQGRSDAAYITKLFVDLETRLRNAGQ